MSYPAMQYVPQRKRTRKFACKNLLLCLLFMFLCRVRTEKKSSRKRRGRRGRPKRKCAAAAAAAAAETGIVWCPALSPAVPPARCAAKPCRKSMACSARVSNTAAIGVHAPTLVLILTHTRAQVLRSHTNSHLFMPMLLHACSLTHLLERSSTQANQQVPPTQTHPTRNCDKLQNIHESFRKHVKYSF